MFAIIFLLGNRFHFIVNSEVYKKTYLLWYNGYVMICLFVEFEVRDALYILRSCP